MFDKSLVMSEGRSSPAGGDSAPYSTTHYPCARPPFTKVTAFLTNEHIIEHALFKIVNLSTMSKIITIMKPMQAVSQLAQRHTTPAAP